MRPAVLADIGVRENLTGRGQPKGAQEQRHTSSHAEVVVQQDGIIILPYQLRREDTVGYSR